MRNMQEVCGIYIMTVEKVENFTAVENYGLVYGRAIYGANLIKDFFARMRDTLGGRVRSYESTIEDAIEKAIIEMANDAKSRGANAVIGVDFEVGAIGRSMLMATCYGTAVELAPDEIAKLQNKK